MAALCAGVKYGLSSKGSFNENKDLIFVKLTDSAVRAIEETLKNRNKFNQNPTIQFLGNEGRLSFPSSHSNNGSTSFKFSLSSTADMEGPGGSLECIQQYMGPSRNELEKLGALSRKMRIQANDDIYEATRQRMAVVEENQKNKCTRVIKPNQTDIGRKVKVKQTGNRILPATTAPRRDVAPVAATPPKPLSTSYQLNPLANRPPTTNPQRVPPPNGLSSNCVTSSRPTPTPKPSNNVSDISKRPIKERLIHLLALKPYKKPELFDRIIKDGIREKERNCITTVLKQIACMRDNTYILHRNIWNDVQDDWPFYTEQERQNLKRRKPQNLTPPGSSDGGSSGSGQSPTSTHPGSPPPPISSSTAMSAKRPGYYDGADGLPTKRQRISHYRKPPVIENNAPRRPITDSRDSSNMNPRSRENLSGNYIASPYNNLYDNKRQYSDDEDEDDNPSRKSLDLAVGNSDSHSLSFGVNREKTFSIPNKMTMSSAPIIIDDARNKEFDLKPTSRNGTVNHMSMSIDEHDREQERIERDRNGREKEQREQSRWNKVTSTTQNTNVLPVRVSPDSQSDPKEPTILRESDGQPEDNEFPDFLTKYSTIRDLEQRRRYKADFNADYEEYRELHATVEKVSRRFAQLEERLKQENASSSSHKEIKKQIYKEYKEIKRDAKYQRAKRRFYYLHEKLSHIKRLVAEYDEKQSGGRY